MTKTQRPIAFVLTAANHGSMIVNRFDYKQVSDGGAFGVGQEIFTTSSCGQGEIDVVLQLLTMRRQFFGDGVLALDCGANIGVHTVEWARMMHSWGEVMAFEAQERVFYALAGNIALNNCFNARAFYVAVGAQSGRIAVPRVNHLRPSSFGSLELRQSSRNEDIGQEISYRPEEMDQVQMIALDDLQLGRLDLMKIDIEGMEIEALAGADRLISRFRPHILLEYIKSDREAIRRFLQARGYRIFVLGINFLAIHVEDPSLQLIKGDMLPDPANPASVVVTTPTA